MTDLQETSPSHLCRSNFLARHWLLLIIEPGVYYRAPDGTQSHPPPPPEELVVKLYHSTMLWHFSYFQIKRDLDEFEGAMSIII